MGVRFYTTKMSPTESLTEVADLLRKYGASRFEQLWDDNGRTVGVRFSLPTPEMQVGQMAIVMRPQMDALDQKLWDEHSIDDLDQVERVAWRQLKGILEGILMAADTGMFTPGQLLLGMAEVTDATGERAAFWDVVREMPALTSGNATALLGPPTPTR